MSYSQPRILAFKCDAAANVLGGAYKAGTDDKHVVLATAKTDKIKGVCMSEVGQVLAVDDPLELAIQGGGGKGLLHGTVSDGDELVWDGTGFVVAATTDYVSAKAMKGGDSGQIIPIEVLGGYFKP